MEVKIAKEDAAIFNDGKDRRFSDRRTGSTRKTARTVKRTLTSRPYPIYFDQRGFLSPVNISQYATASDRLKAH
ncbi:MAG TPA: hypothetical protein DCM70_04790 [Rhodobacteraceae bacterium]|nr:hypothetical protein [Paracoccaceae bacterium]